MFDARGQYRRSFIPTDGGYLYYPHRWSGGYLITEEELETLIAQLPYPESFTAKLKFFGIVFATFFGMALIAIAMELSEQHQRWLTIALAIVLAAYLFSRSRGVNRMIRNRQPVAPPRSSREAERAMGKAMGKPMLVFLSFIMLSWLFAAILYASDSPWLGIPLSLGTAIFAFLMLRLTWRSFFP